MKLGVKTIPMVEVSAVSGCRFGLPPDKVAKLGRIPGLPLLERQQADS